MLMKKMIGILYFALFLAFLTAGRELTLNRDPDLQNAVPETNKAREEFKDIIFSGINTAKQRNNTLIKQNEGLDPVLFTLKEDTDYYYLLFLNQVNTEFPLLHKGNFSIKKKKINGEFQYFTILLRNENDSYIRIAPFNDKTRMDIFLFGSPLYRNINLPLPFTKLIAASFGKIKEMTAGVVDWNLVLYRHFTNQDTFIVTTINRIHKVLPLLKDADDGSYNASGELVFIADETRQKAGGGLNCSGFAKWLVDGFYYSLQHSLFEISTLKQRLSEFRGTRWSKRFEGARDPYFGLDWTRNLAAALYEAENNRTVTDFEMFDVRDIPCFRYIEDMGFQVTDLKLLLYLLTLEKPGRIYLGSINGQWGKDPVLRQHYHIVALLPFFLQDGSFKIAVFERNQETGVDSFIKRYAKENIHLVKIETKLEFSNNYMEALLSLNF